MVGGARTTTPTSQPNTGGGANQIASGGTVAAEVTVFVGGTSNGGTSNSAGGTTGSPTGGTSNGGTSSSSGGTSTAQGGSSNGGATIGTSAVELGTGLGAIWITTPDGNCAGTLISNQWVLTANTCVSCNRLANEVLVQYGNQLRQAERIARYPGGDCVQGDPVDSHDVMLLRLSAPMTVDGRVYGYNQTPAWWSTFGHQTYPFVTLTAFGWDMAPTKPWNQVPVWQENELPNQSIDSDTVFNGKSLGDQIWVGPTEQDSGQVVLPTANDLGSGLWATMDGQQYYVGVSAWYPRISRNYSVGSNREARYSSITDASTKHFLCNTLTGPIEFDGFSTGSAFSAVVKSVSSTDYFWIGDDHQLKTRRRTSDTMAAEEDLGAPPTSSKLVIEQPGVTPAGANRVWLWVQDASYQLWAKSRISDKWQDGWTQVALTAMPILFGVAGASYGNGDLYILGVNNEGRLRYAVLDANGNRIKDWTEYPNIPSDQRWNSKPALFAYSPTVLVLHVLGSDGCIAYGGMYSADNWEPLACSNPGATGGPVNVSYRSRRLDAFYRTGSTGQLVWTYADNAHAVAADSFDGELDPTFAPMTLTSPFEGAYELAWRVGTRLRILRYPY